MSETDLANEKEGPGYDQEQYDMLLRCSMRKDMRKWNEWREENPDTQINLREANLSSANLSSANLSWANLQGARLHGADLSGADLTGAYLAGANLVGVNLRRADLSQAGLSGAIVDESTLRETKQIKGVQLGVNGIWVESTDSAALMAMTSLGNSMQGPDPEPVLESLKRSRCLHGFSLLLAITILLMAVLDLKEMKLPWVEDTPIPVDLLGLLAMSVSMGLLILVNSFLTDALKGAQYLQDRRSAMSVGKFPWVLSRYAGGGWPNGPLSCFVRFVSSFHTLAYVYFSAKWYTYDLMGDADINRSAFVVLSFLALVISSWTFVLSERLQRPILFDSRTEAEKEDELPKVAQAITEELLDVLKPEQMAG